ncbi:universal stress protein [Cognatiyoonia sp. IB215182]|uniref:universal stress protein n=1 Tax=Cognatiyoonia sp. IB215182 TaxID=3097353 RepID=UPI002A18032A|nr:universal stress protein [Cognatiyoonia sp. IB215182]MDX8354943.1 universal stress protein [Cognatiyoonia sp. IB215182]
MIKKILAAYDGSDNAQRALDLAVELCAKCDASLVVVHVLMHGRPAAELVRMAHAEHMVQEAHKAISPGVTFASGRAYDLFSASADAAGTLRVISSVGDQLVAHAKNHAEELGLEAVQTVVRSGDYADEILAVANDQMVDMIVMGSRGLGLVRGAVVGSVSQKVMHHAEQAVLAVK